MALTDESTGNGFYMPVAPAYNGGNGGFGFGGDWAWIIILLLVFGGGWGMGGFGGGMWPMMMGGMDGFGLYPWLNNSQNINGGFRDQMLNTSISSIGDKIASGFGDVQLGIAGINQNLCQTGNGIVNDVNSGFNAAEAAANARQIANMQQAFAAQTAQAQGFNSLGSQLASCCCENRLAAADAKFTTATEACATRTANAENTNAVINAISAGIQSIKDDLCNDRLEAERRENANLRTQLSMAQLAASQNAQTAAIEAGQRTLANEIEQYVLPTPRPAYVVQNPNCCSPYAYTSCGCGA